MMSRISAYKDAEPFLVNCMLRLLLKAIRLSYAVSSSRLDVFALPARLWRLGSLLTVFSFLLVRVFILDGCPRDLFLPLPLPLRVT
jgi:hypothetical protein